MFLRAFILSTLLLELPIKGAAETGNGDVTLRTKEVLRLLKNPADNAFQIEIKTVLAKYLVEMTMLDDDAEAARFDSEAPIPYGKHHHNSNRDRDRYDQLLQKLQEQQLQLQQLKQTSVAAPAPVNTAVPPSTLNQQAKQEPIPPATVPVAPAPAAVSISQTAAPALPETKVEDITPVPIILSSPSPVSTGTSQPVVPPAAEIPVTTPVPTTPRPTVDPVHHINQVNKILGNVANGNIVGIVDESLAIRAPPPVRNLVTNIMKVIFCNPIDRLFGRCAPNQIDAANNSVKGK